MAKKKKQESRAGKLSSIHTGTAKTDPAILKAKADAKKRNELLAKKKKEADAKKKKAIANARKKKN